MFCADEKVQEKVKLQSMLDLYSIAMENSRYATALPPPFNIIGLFYELCTFFHRYTQVKAFWPKSNSIKLFGLYLSRNSSEFQHRDHPSLEEDDSPKEEDRDKVKKNFGKLVKSSCEQIWRFFFHREDDSPKEEKRSEMDLMHELKLRMFMENARKDYLANAVRGDHETGVEKCEGRVTHMQETVVHILETKIEDRIQKIQDKLEQCFPADKEEAGGHIEDSRDTFAVCGYLTDVESNFDYFERYLAISQIIGWSDEESAYVPNVKQLKFKRDDAIFVFGGDSQDKGIGDIRFTKLMLELRQNYPGRVEFIIGNRDANKLRFGSELTQEAIDDPKVLIDKSFPYWDKEARRITPQMFLDDDKYVTPPNEHGSKNTAANRLRWILDTTMGANGAFERRRHELSILRRCEKTDVTDDNVVASYRDEVDPLKPPGLKWVEVPEKPKSQKCRSIINAGLVGALQQGRLEFTKKELDEFEVFNHFDSLSYTYSCYVEVDDARSKSIKYFTPANTDGNNFMLQYLKHGKLAFVFGSNLFLHGAITEHNKGQVPGATEEHKVHHWADALNKWAKSEVEAFENDAEKKSGSLYTARNGGGLMDYGVPMGDGVQGGGDKTVVYSNFLDNKPGEKREFFENNAKHISPDVQEYLLKGKIKTVVTGHQPHGDCPCIIRSGAVTVITADTSIGQKGYTSKWGHTDDRGLGPPVSEVLLYADGTSEVHGVLLDGTKIAYKLGVGGDKYVGRQLSDGYWVKAKIAPGKGCTHYNSSFCLKWKEVQGSQKPTEGQEIKNEALAAKLQEQKVEFTQEEWEKLKVFYLYDKCYIKAGNKYFEPAHGTTEENNKVVEDSALEQPPGWADGILRRLDHIESEPEYVIAALQGFSYIQRRMKLSELESLTDAHFIFQRCNDKKLEEAGIDSAFHGVLISAGLDIDTLKMAAGDRRYLDSVLKEAGISKPGGRKITKSDLL